MTSTLRVDLHVTELIPIATPKPLPFGIPQTWSHMASTLISGEKEAMLIDPPLTIKQGNEISAWIKGVLGPKKKLTTIYITHGHGDHYFAATTVLKHFPDAKVFATKATLQHMAQQIEPEYYAAWWEASFPREVEKPSAGLAKALDGYTIDLEDHAINIIEAGHSDTHDSTFVHIPDLSMVVAGDVWYNELHQWLAEAVDEPRRNAWIAALEKIASLKPATVIASHKRPGAVDGINNVYSTISYIRALKSARPNRRMRQSSITRCLHATPSASIPSFSGSAAKLISLNLVETPATCGSEVA
jgi:glyoxylase-like metal-dependent hydrolase (beta-lactamase superfamily II)